MSIVQSSVGPLVVHHHSPNPVYLQEKLKEMNYAKSWECMSNILTLHY